MFEIIAFIILQIWFILVLFFTLGRIFPKSAEKFYNFDKNFFLFKKLSKNEYLKIGKRRAILVLPMFILFYLLFMYTFLFDIFNWF